MSNINPDIEALARVLAAIESRRSEWGFSLDAALDYREEKWPRHIWEAQRLLEEMAPWLSERDRVVAERAWDEGFTRGFYAGQSYPDGADASEPDIDNPYRKEQENNNA